MGQLELSDFKVGERVIYVPNHVDSFGLEEQGIVSSINELFVFVKYGANKTAQATRPQDLRKAD